MMSRDVVAGRPPVGPSEVVVIHLGARLIYLQLDRWARSSPSLATSCTRVLANIRTSTRLLPP